jgi:hypothetical protein
MADDWTPDLGINQSIEIIEGGVKRVIQSDRAVIYNGMLQVGWLNFIDEDPWVINNPATEDYTIQSLRFEKAPMSSIITYGCKDLTIKDNIITNVVPDINPFFGMYEAEGIAIIGGHELTGTADILNNYIDIFGDEQANDPIVPWSGSGQWPSTVLGIFILGTTGENYNEVHVRDNFIKNAASGGILLESIVTATTNIEGNDIHQRHYNNAYGENGKVYLKGEGIVISMNGYGDMTIARNRIDKAYGRGISIWGEVEYGLTAENIHILDNEIEMALFENEVGEEQAIFDCYSGLFKSGGIAISGTSADVDLRGNTITGTSAYGIFMDDLAHLNEVYNPADGLSNFTPADPSQMPSSDVWQYESKPVFLGEATHDNKISGVTADMVLDPPHYDEDRPEFGYVGCGLVTTVDPPHYFAGTKLYFDWETETALGYLARDPYDLSPCPEQEEKNNTY